MSSSSLFNSSHHKFSLDDIIDPTNNFDLNRLYAYNENWMDYFVHITSYDFKSKTETMGMVFVRRFNELSQFMNAVRSLIYHTPDVLLGYCTDSGEKILVYKYKEIAIAQPSPQVDLVNASSSWEFGNEEEILSFSPSSYRKFSLGEITDATNNFNEDNIIRTVRGFENFTKSTEYKAKFAEYTVVAKRFGKDILNSTSFIHELRKMTLRPVHANLISLLGYCTEADEKILVYEYMENGRLIEYVKEDVDIILSWKKRLNICLGVAYGLQELHKLTAEFPHGIVHGKVNAANVLLDENWDANLSNFEIARAVEEEDLYSYTLGERIEYDVCSTKLKEVHDFGRLLFQVLCRKKLLHQGYRDGEENYDDISFTVDYKIREEVSPNSFSSFKSAIGKCFPQRHTKNPSILDVVVLKLEEALKCQVVNDFISNFGYNEILLALASSSYRQFTLAEIKEATNNFDGMRISGSGHCFLEYDINSSKTEKAKENVIVKCFSEEDNHFGKEAGMMTFVKAHPTLISLVGYCTESNERILVYEHPENGSLADYVEDGCKISFSWKMRLNICLGVAYALQHLHKLTPEFPSGIVHGDVYAENILLDENWAPKLSMFRSSNFGNEENFNKALDIRLFGCLLIKMLCQISKQDLKILYDNKIDLDYGLWARQNVDILIKRETLLGSLKVFTDVIGKCMQNYQSKCPSMDVVVLDLEAALKCQKVTYGELVLDVDLITSSSRSESSIIGGVKESDSMDGFSSSSSSSYSFSFNFSSSSSLRLFYSCQQFPLDEIKMATNNFDKEKCLGKGGEGTVYRGEIYLDSKTEKSTVAVKHLEKGFTSEFEKEIATVANFRHPNIVSLFGYCNESDEKVLIYEYMGKGSLSDYVKMNSKVCLSWKQRLNICLDAAKGLECLHKETEQFSKGIIHRDVKPENILIDDNWVAKVSDFGMLKLSTVAQTNSTMLTLNIKGTRGYFAPETLYSKKLSKKIDVYAFGFVMFEVLCRKKRWDIVENKSLYLEEEEEDDDDDDIMLLAKKNIDSKIKDEITDSCQRIFIDTIVECMQYDPKRRPTMGKVVLKLEEALKCQEQSEG